MNSAGLISLDRIVSSPAPRRGEKEDTAALVDGFLSRGAEDCFEGLVDRYKDRVFRLAASVMGPGFSADAEDITQEVFIQVFRKLSTFRRESSFATWLYRIAYNQALERRRKARFRIPHQGEKALNAMVAPAEQNDPVEAAVKGQRNRAVLKSLDALDEPHRTAIYLHYWMKCTVSDIAESLGTRPGTVKSYLYRGRKRLAQILKKEREDGSDL
jgi:RNA polymerase sigma-70 factor, ECF subfamily